MAFSRVPGVETPGDAQKVPAGLRRAGASIPFLEPLLLAALPCLLFSARALAQGEANEVPRLHPFHDEIPPTFWEQYGAWVLAAGLVLLGCAGLVVWRLTRPRAPVVPAAAVQAREALAALPATAGEGATLSRVSQILRLYVQRAFGLPPVELTTAEFCQALSASSNAGPELAGVLTSFLRENDRQKFSPARTNPAAAQAVAQARALIDQCEARQASRRAARTAASAAAPKPA
jgi:hypothetical protein